ncbi:MAG: rod shape-determining protein MreC, partial [Bacteroidota bacterium]
KANNYITIEKGRKQGVLPGMGVISPEGVVGKVTESSTHYARVMSVLHRDIRISAQLKSNGYVGYIDWNGKDARFVKMKDVPTPVAVKKGDRIIASGYNAFFPQGTTIGTVAKVEKLPDATFHDITVKLATDFNSLTYVYIIGNNLKQEKDSLESKK